MLTAFVGLFAFCFDLMCLLCDDCVITCFDGCWFLIALHAPGIYGIVDFVGIL